MAGQVAELHSSRERSQDERHSPGIQPVQEEAPLLAPFVGAPAAVTTVIVNKVFITSVIERVGVVSLQFRP